MNVKTPVEIPENLDRYLTCAVYVRYNAGSAGVGWPADRERNVRVPWVKLANALEEFDNLISGSQVRASGLPDGIVPDHVRVVIEPYTGRSYNYAQCAPFIGTYATFTKEA